MQRALQLAAKGLGNVSPNPMVGCVIVKDGEIIGEGYHEKYGSHHAEVNAVHHAGKENVRGSEVYVTLEPCSHYGKTPPCADLLAGLLPKKVIICNTDTNPLVAGEGIQKLKDVGIEVQTGVLEKEGRELNKRFFTFMEKKRPYIILKWAQTKDGFIARENYDSKWISGEDSRKQVHQWRAEEEAIMVGTNTALHDNPSLNLRFGIEGNLPVRVVIDKQLKLPQSYHLFDQSQTTLCYNLLEDKLDEQVQYIKLSEDEFLKQLFDDLHKRKILSIIVEGGSYLLNSLIDKQLWDEARVFTSQEVLFQKGINSPELKDHVEIQENQFQGDRLIVYTRL